MDAIEWYHDLQVAAFDPFGGLRSDLLPGEPLERGVPRSPGGVGRLARRVRSGLTVAGTSTAHVGGGDEWYSSQSPAVRGHCSACSVACFYWHMRPKTGGEAPTKALPPERSGFRCPNLESGSCFPATGTQFWTGGRSERALRTVPGVHGFLASQQQRGCEVGSPGYRAGLGALRSPLP